MPEFDTIGLQNLTEDQRVKLRSRLIEHNSHIIRLYQTGKNIYVKLLVESKYTETRYWYAARGRVNLHGKKINDNGRWKLVG